MDELDRYRPWLILLRTPGLGPGGLRAALSASGGDADAALAALRGRRDALSNAARRWLGDPDERRLAMDLAWLAEPGHRLLLHTDEDFPPQLESISQPPAALFVAGDASLLLRPQLAVVGARAATLSGRTHARAFAQVVGRAGFVITSGLADGIDGAAHLGALDDDLPTLAVVGTGPDRVYPRKHQLLARRVVEHGAMISEFPPGTAARADHFPRRNRILSGLALGTLVVEAGLCSGSLITARLAAEQGREVFALPGSIHNPLAQGCHRLIREGARLVETAGEIVEALTPAAVALGHELAIRLASVATVPGQPELEAGLDSTGRALLETLGHATMTLEELAEHTGQAVARLSSALLMLELAGWVEALPGNRYQRLPKPVCSALSHDPA
ncbi:DNA-processing protein DprA [Dyella sp. C9]|uniref:DNA-processing protein DprA n=1 Tax=Dyella sp. C9 TaxID=2202154 RepID=UPI000DEF441C|nr:DNA-processing protein DprA [Dyella sp. C9]